MITVLKSGVSEQQRNQLIEWFEDQGLRVHISEGEYQTVLGLIGDTSRIDEELVASLDMVDTVKRISEPYKKANRKFHPEQTKITVGDVTIGDGSLVVLAGPCSVESEEQILEVAEKVKAAGASILWGGAFKSRTSPYAFQGMQAEGIGLLLAAKKATGLPIMTEITSAENLALYEDVDILQVGSRSMQNFELLKQLGRCNKPVLLKRGISNTLKELLMSAEYIMAGGNEQVILCERGIRTFETTTKNTLDLSAIPALREMTHLPILVDPSQATGNARMVEPMALAATAAGADGLIIEVHNNPGKALCDGALALTPEQFAAAAEKLRKIHKALK